MKNDKSKKTRENKVKKQKRFSDFLPTCGVYAIINKLTGRSYIGQSRDIGHRWKEHIKELESGSHHNRAFQSDWDKYGKENFAIQILMNCIPENLLPVEQVYIKEYKKLAGTYNE